MIAGLPLSFAATAAAARPVEPAGAVVAAARDAAAAAADRVSADAAAVRHRAEGRNPVAHAVVADRCCGWPPRRWSSSPPPVRSGIRRPALAGSNAPLVILLDDGWSAASSWETRIKAADELIANADNDRRGVALVPLSEPARDITLMPAGTARVALRQLAPKPYSIERVETLPALERFLKATGDAEIAWLSDGVDTGRGTEFVEGSRQDHRRPHADGVRRRRARRRRRWSPPENAAAKMTVKVLRTAGGIAAGVVRAIDAKGSPIGEARYAFAPQDRETEAAFDLPVELRNDIARLEISGERSAGAVQLLDKRWRRRAIGVVTGRPAIPRSRCWHRLSISRRALSPFADVRLGDRGAPQQVIAQFLDQRLPMIVMADVGTLSPEIRERLNAWIDQGGVLVRFAGPRLAQADDDLVPVKLRRGGRSLGGSLTWEKPQHLAVVRCRWTVRGPCRPEGRHRQPAGARRAGCGAGDQELGVAGRRHAARHRRASRQGRGQPVPRQRRHALVGSADVRHLRRDAATDRRHVRLYLHARRRRSREHRRSKPWRRCARSTALARSVRRPRPPSRCRPTIATARRPTIRRASTARPKDRSPSTRWRSNTSSSSGLPRLKLRIA